MVAGKNGNPITLIPLGIKGDLGKCLEMITCSVLVRDSQGTLIHPWPSISLFIYFSWKKKSQARAGEMAQWLKVNAK